MGNEKLAFGTVFVSVEKMVEATVHILYIEIKKVL